MMNKSDKYLISTKSIARIAMWLVMLVVNTNVHAAITSNFEPSENLQKTAKSFLEEMTISADKEDIDIKVGNIDPRLKLKKCKFPLEAYLPPGSRTMGKISVGIKCSGPIPWKIFLSATRFQYKTVIYAKNTLRKGQLIGKYDIGLKRIKINNRHKQPTIDFSQVISTSPRRFIRAGSVIYQDSICMVCRGDKVFVSTGNDFFSINVDAEAMADASIGESVRLKNESSHRIFDGKVTGRNKAQVYLP